jgi:hypothetical protein
MECSLILFVLKYLTHKQKTVGEIGLGGVDWIRLAQDRDRWQAIVSVVMNLWVLAPWS